MKGLIDGSRSKLNLTKSIIEENKNSNLGIPVPNSIYKYYGQSLDSIKSDFDAMKKPVIVRGSTKFDYFADIDIAPTKRDIYTFEELEKFVKGSEKFMSSELVKFHREDYGFVNSSEIDFIIQEQVFSNILGTMIRNPHTAEIHIEYKDITKSDYATNYAYYYSSGELDHITDSVSISDEELLKLIFVFEKGEHSGLLIDKFTHQMEFSLSPLFSLQFRIFKEKTSVSDFEIPNPKDYSLALIGDLCFGVTNSKGIELPFYENFLLNDTSEAVNSGQNYGLIQRILSSDSPSLETSLKNLYFFGSPCRDFGFLFHGNYRPTQRANLVMISPRITKNGVYDIVSDRVVYPKPYKNNFRAILDNLNDFKKSTVFANGKDMIAVPTKYL